MEQCFGVSLSVQMKYETYIMLMDNIEPLPNYFDNVPESWYRNFELYCVTHTIAYYGLPYSRTIKTKLEFDPGGAFPENFICYMKY
jgi:hypothetical protein